jgi:Lecithin:cholesterol acyltransferase
MCEDGHMAICYYLPGLGGSALVGQQSGIQVWGSVLAATLFPLSTLGLAGDGVSPAVPCGVALQPSGLYADYYGAALVALTSSLQASGTDIVPYSWDWRHALSEIGASLASTIQSQVSPAAPCSIVAHSAGGLIARYAWLVLGQAGAQDLVRRIVTYGTPHQGSYGAVQLWSLDSSSLTQVQYLALARAALDPLGPVNPCEYLLQSSLAGVTTTWPALYDTLPLIGGTEDAADPNRVVLFNAGNWQGPVTPSQAWLTQARLVTQPWLLSPASMPPSWVLTTIAGIGAPTVSTLLNPGSLGAKYAYAALADGDGTVTSGSALVPLSAQYTVTGMHNDLPLLLADTGLLAEAVLAVRTPPAPPPPAELLPGALIPLLGGPPIPSLGYPAGGRSPMVGC